MEYKVEKSFRDKETQKAYEKGSVYHSQDEQRIEFLEKSGYISKASETNAKMAKQNKKLEKAEKQTRSKKVESQDQSIQEEMNRESD